MDNEKTGRLIRELRTQKGLTQAQLAGLINVSDKAVSKWERGLGCPDVSLLGTLSEVLEVNIDRLLEGELGENSEAVTMNKIKFYICEKCGSVFTSLGGGELSCCGKKLSPLELKNADEAHALKLEEVEDEWYVTCPHEMTKEHYISFIAFVSYDRVTLVKTYPEQDLAVRFPRNGAGYFCYYCTNDGFYKFKP
ncbi:helix-turn-helix domain-containing protein [uncultured Ruminococcus sp.]|uniref:helix-turn-helix domain-containing protein n=1 Tax=uncultured Ruminococcus sp. TaxID=165186 RepID=UPI0025DEE58B|nr:helix-turn-helix domain-containing protein [uncultured Ruminococcus sp.]